MQGVRSSHLGLQAFSSQLRTLATGGATEPG